jgi:hypothetical protein
LSRRRLLAGVTREWALAALGLAALVLASFPDAVFRGRVFYERDLHIDWYTQMESFARSVAAGSWPVWDTTIAFGQPLLADPSAQILYPLTWLNLALPPWRYYTIFVVVHTFFGGLGLFQLCRRLRVSFLGSLLAAALWVCSGPFLSMLNTWQHFAAASWIGWVLLAAHVTMESPGLASSMVWGAVMAGQVLAGSADVCAMSWLLMAGYGLTRFEWKRPASPSNRRLAVWSAAACGAALALSCAVWLPALDVARRSSRWNYPESVRAAWSLQPATLAGLVVPVRVEDLPRALPRPLAPAPESREPLLPSLYLGLATVPLVAIALVSRRRASVFLSVVVALGLLIAVGSHGTFYPLVVRLIPPLGIFRYPSKTMVVVAFAWAALAGIGLDALAGSRARHRATLFVWLGALIILAMAESHLPEPDAWGHLPLAVGCALCAALSLSPRRAATGLAPRWAAAAAVFAIADVFIASRGLNRTAPAELLAFRPAAVRAVERGDRSRLYVYDYMVPGKSLEYLGREDPYMIRMPPRHAPIETIRVLSQRQYLFPPVGGRWGLEGSFDVDFRGLYPLPLARLVDLVRRVEGTPGLLRLLRIGAVGTVMALHTEGFEDLVPEQTLPSYFPEPIHVLRVPGPLPRTYAVGGAREADGGAAFAALLDPRFDPTREIVLPHGDPSVGAVPGAAGSSRVVDFKPDRVSLEADMTTPGFVVLVDSYDPGWRATVDEASVRVLRANVAFRAVRVPAGHHRIELVYRPPAVLWGLAISGFAAIAMASAMGFLGHRDAHRSLPA